MRWNTFGSKQIAFRSKVSWNGEEKANQLVVLVAGLESGGRKCRACARAEPKDPQTESSFSEKARDSGARDVLRAPE